MEIVASGLILIGVLLMVLGVRFLQRARTLAESAREAGEEDRSS